MKVPDHTSKPNCLLEKKVARTLTFDSASHIGVNPFDAMSEFSQGLYRYSKHASDIGDTPQPYLRLKAWILGGVPAASFEHSAMTVDGTMKIDSELQDYVMLRVVKKGNVPLRSGNEEKVMVPGKIYIYHPNHLLLPSHDGASIGLRLPRCAINYFPSIHSRIFAFENENPIGRVVSSAISSLFDQVEGLTENQTHVAGQMICNLVQTLLTTKPVDEATYTSWHIARDQAMRTFLFENLKDPEVGMEQLMARFGASRATIYRSFSAEGGVMNFIRTQRLKAIYRELRSTPYSYGSVRRIAESYGFTDQSIFSKSFKRQFGFRPLEVVNTKGLKLDDQPFKTETVFRDIPNLASFWSAGR